MFEGNGRLKVKAVEAIDVDVEACVCDGDGLGGAGVGEGPCEVCEEGAENTRGSLNTEELGSGSGGD